MNERRERAGMSGLSEAERDVLMPDLYAAVGAIVAARLASVEALADEWEALGDTDSAFWWSTLAIHLRAALRSDAHTEQKGTGE